MADDIQLQTISERNGAGTLKQIFPGELVLAQANVMKYDSMSDRSSGTVGTFYVTNFKIAFVASSLEEDFNLPRKESSSGLDRLLCEEVNQNYLDYVPLTAILNVYAVSTLKQKRKKLKPARNELSLKYDIMEIHTKDMRVLNYDFKFAQAEKQKQCFQKLVFHMFPKLTSNLFAFDYGYGESEVPGNVAGRAFCMFTNQKDYEVELARLLGFEKWRVSRLNYGYGLCKSLPEFNVCPATLTDEVLKDLAYAYLDQRFPVWLWSDPKSGSSLLISSTPRSDDEVMEGHPGVILQHIKDCHAQHTGCKVHAIDVGIQCPEVKLVQHSYDLIRNACLFNSSRDFWLTDTDWLTKVEGSRWLEYVQVCLRQAVDVARQIKGSNTSVILNEVCGRNFSILIASLAQILLDPYYRTLIGFQALIQKDWVMKGHPFARRLAHLKPFKVVKDFTIRRASSVSKKGKDTFVSYDLSMGKSASMESIDDFSSNGTSDGDCPLFLLFLNAVYQLLHQFPIKFEFTEQFLMLLMDCAYSCLFDTFLFDSPYERHGGKSGALKLTSAWDFISTSIPNAKSRAILVNPSFSLQGTSIFEFDGDSLSSSHSSSSSRHSFHSAIGNDVLYPDTSLCSLDFWSGYFLRWLPCADMRKGCCTQAMLHVQQEQLVNEVHYLTDRLQRLQLLRMQSRHSDSSTCPEGVEVSPAESEADHLQSRCRKSASLVAEDNYLDLINGFYFLKLLN